MSTTSPLPHRQHLNRPASLAVVGLGLLLVPACLSLMLLAWGRRLAVRPVVLHVGQVALSAEITDNPSCAPLTNSCWVLPAGDRAKYFSVWAYTMTPQAAGTQTEDWHVLALQLSRGGPPAPSGSPECWPSC